VGLNPTQGMNDSIVCVYSVFSCSVFAGSRPDEVDIFILPNPPGRTGPGVDSASNRNECQES
jgi:hypothetical protein